MAEARTSANKPKTAIADNNREVHASTDLAFSASVAEMHRSMSVNLEKPVNKKHGE
ncbi:hypothetical protein AAVH_17998 [Aphelenchoides avenae]|nr:hypothetical protein AAVH_17998 [Aphelenchus avenae]